VAGKTLLRAVIDATGLSRRRAFEAIRAGRVSLRGEPVADPSRPYDGGALALDGRSLESDEQREHVYLLMNKPPDVITTNLDEMGRRTVLDLVPKGLRRPGLHPVGRLDRDTTGLLMLTNDGDVTYRLTHPRHQVEKEYLVGLAESPSSDQIARLRRGVWLGGRLRRPVKVERLPELARPYHLSVVIREGRKHQVKQMLAAIGGKVKYLKRTREGHLRLEDLREGAVRRLTTEEVALLRADSERV
jgi:23S rRNA pseudouridine2605 synthase